MMAYFIFSSKYIIRVIDIHVYAFVGSWHYIMKYVLQSPKAVNRGHRQMGDIQVPTSFDFNLFI